MGNFDNRNLNFFLSLEVAYILNNATASIMEDNLKWP